MPDTIDGPWMCEGCRQFNAGSEPECEECGRPKGWEYDGPDDVGDTCSESLSERMDRYRRLK